MYSASDDDLLTVACLTDFHGIEPQPHLITKPGFDFLDCGQPAQLESQYSCKTHSCPPKRRPYEAVPLRYSRTSLILAKQPHVGLAVNLARYETEKAISGLVLFAMCSNATAIDLYCEMAATFVMTEPARTL